MTARSPGIWRGLFATGILLIVVGSLLTLPEPGYGHGDLAAHAVAYGTLMTLGLLGWRGRRAWVLLFFGLAALGVAIEAAQALAPGRTPSAADAMANLLGIVGAAAIRAGWRRRARRSPDRR